MKKSNEGFILIETLVVSTFILTTLVFLYVQFSNVKRSYDISFRYNTINDLYYAKELSNYLKSDGYQIITSQVNSNNYLDITNCIYSGELCSKIKDKIKAKQIIYVNSSIIPLQNEIKNNSSLSKFDPEFKKFILNLTEDSDGRNRLIIEFEDLTFASVTIAEGTN